MITENIVLWDTDVGRIRCNLKKMLKKKNINIYQFSRISGIKYDVLKRYAGNDVIKYDANVLAKICYSLKCNISDLLEYVNRK